jgi:hypothetical protein
VRLAAPAPGARTLEPDPEILPRIYAALGFPLVDGQPTRADLVERPPRRRRRKPRRAAGVE